VKKKSPPYAIIGAVVLGVIAIAAFYKHEQDQKAAAQAAIDQANKDAQAKIDAANAHPTINTTEVATDQRAVLCATQPVEPGIRMSPAFYEKTMLPKTVFPDAYTEGSDITGFFAIRKIEKGDPLTPRNIGKSLPYMSQRISPGMRAIALSVFTPVPVNATGQYVVDGDRVDLLYTTKTSTVSTPGFLVNTQTVMQNVNVLSVPGSQIKTEKTDGINPSVAAGSALLVTFEVTPEQAQALTFLSRVKEGEFTMILRARKDDSEIKIKPFESEDYDLYKLTKVQKIVDKSNDRVKALGQEIEDKEKAQAAQGKPNEPTTTPTSTP
jgi:Flp pilus assembly protein CpaB